LAGGHIDISASGLGLAVTGIIQTIHIKQNSTATAGCRLFLSKPLGTGILSTAAKRNLLEESDYLDAVTWMTRLNTAGIELGTMKSVSAMTDVTGFGLLGHLLEICEGSRLAARLHFSAPKLGNINHYIEKNCIPGGTHRNWNSYGDRIGAITDVQKMVLADPQTSGGLLVAVDQKALDFDAYARENNLVEIGVMEQISDTVWIRIED
jgi:selenide,water dikinase